MVKKLDVKMRGIVDNIVFSDKEVWAYYTVDTTGYDFLNTESKMGMLYGITQSFSDLMNNRDERLPVHMIITNTPVNIDHWEEQYAATTDAWDTKPGFSRYFQNQVKYLKEQQYLSRKVYLGVKIGNRHEVSGKKFMVELSGGFKQALAYLKNTVFSPMGLNDPSIPQGEIDIAKGQEKTYYNFFANGAINAERPEAEELALVAKRVFYPAMPTPFLDIPANGRWNKGDMARELTSDITRNRKWTEISQPMLGTILTGYRATLTFSSFPENQNVPRQTPWIYMTQKIGLPFDIYGRFDLIPNKHMKKEIAHQRMDLEDEGNNAGESGRSPSLDWQDDYSKAQELEAFTNKDASPWLEGTYRLVVTASDKESLAQIVEIVTQAYSQNGIVLTWTTGDQQDLLLEFMPGDKLREKSFQQTSNVELIGASGFNIFNKVGDDDMRMQ